MKIIYKRVEWLEKQGALVANVPPHITIHLTATEQKELLSSSQAFFLRWNSQYDVTERVFWYIIKEHFGGIEELSANTKSKLRRGDKKAYVQLFDPLIYINELYYVYAAASKRYDTFEKIMDQESFVLYIKNLPIDKYDFFGVFDKETDILIAYSQNLIEKNTCFYEEIFYNPEYLKNYIGYILIFEMNHFYLQKSQLLYVHDGSINLSHPTQIHDFLIQKFKFQKVYTRMEISYRKDIAIVVNILYPFRKMIERCPLNICKKISILLKHEIIRRSYD